MDLRAVRGPVMGPLVATLLVLSGGCVIDTVPLPENRSPDLNDGTTGGSGGGLPTRGAGGSGGVGMGDSPDEDSSGNFSMDRFYWSDEGGSFTFLVGVVGALPAAGNLIVINPSRPDEYRGPITAEGSFAGVINASIYDTVELSYERDGAIVASVLLDLRPGSVDAYAANATLDAAGGITASRQATGSTVVVEGPPDSLPVGTLVVVSNPRTSAAVRALTAADGSFRAELPALAGDELLLFAVEPASSQGGGPVVRLIVP